MFMSYTINHSYMITLPSLCIVTYLVTRHGVLTGNWIYVTLIQHDSRVAGLGSSWYNLWDDPSENTASDSCVCIRCCDHVIWLPWKSAYNHCLATVVYSGSTTVITQFLGYQAKNCRALTRCMKLWSNLLFIQIYIFITYNNSSL
jgi:hypothetical protein